MTMEQASQLQRIYNTLFMIKTSGEDAILMGKSLEALQELLPQIKIEQPEEGENTPKGE